MAEVGAAVEVGRMDQRVKPIIRRNQTKKVPIHIKKKVMAKGQLNSSAWPRPAAPAPPRRAAQPSSPLVTARSISPAAPCSAARFDRPVASAAEKPSTLTRTVKVGPWDGPSRDRVW